MTDLAGRLTVLKDSLGLEHVLVYNPGQGDFLSESTPVVGPGLKKQLVPGPSAAGKNKQPEKLAWPSELKAGRSAQLFCSSRQSGRGAGQVVWLLLSKKPPRLDRAATALLKLIQADVNQALQNQNPFPVQIREKLQSMRGEMISVVDKDGLFRYVNKQWTTTLGCTEEQMLGRSFFDFVDEDSMAETLAVFQKYRNTSGKVLRFKNNYRGCDGRKRTLLWYSQSDVNNCNFYSITTDITDSEEAGHRLADSEEKLRKLFKLSPFGIALNRMDGSFVECNRAMTTITGYTLDELNRLSYWDLTPRDYADQEKIQLELLDKKKRYGPYVKQYIHKKGHRFDVRLNGMLLETRSNERYIWSIVEDITAEKSTHDNLARSEELYRSVVTSLSEGLVLHQADGQISFSNDAACQILGLTREQMAGLDSFDPRWRAVKEDGSDLPGSEHPAMVTLSTGRPCKNFIMGVHRGDGSQAWILVNSQPLKSGLGKIDGVVATFLDITRNINDRHEIEKLAFLAQNTDNAVTITDPDKKIEWVNKAYEQISGYSLVELKGRPAGRTVQGIDTDREEVDRIRQALKHNRPVHAELLNYHKSGQPYWVAIGIFPILDKHNEVKNFISIQSDITGRKEREQQLHRVTEELARRNRELQQFNRVISHNLRSPLSNIIGFIELFNRILADPDRNEERFVEIAAHLQTAAQKLDQVFHEVTSVLENRHGNAEIKTAVSIKETVKGIRVMLRKQIDETNTSFDTSKLAVKEINCIESLFSSIMLNLISNAIKYSSPGRRPEIKITARRAADHVVELTVEDNGLGIDLDRYGDELFSMYRRFHKNVEGRGLGLYLVKTQVEVMGGNIRVESKPGLGSRFIINLPQ